MRRVVALCLWSSVVTAVSAVNVGCATQKHWQARSETTKAAYLEWLESPYIPTHEEVKAAGVPWSFNRSMDEVWQSCVDVAVQYSAVLASRRSAGGSHQLVLTPYLSSGYFVFTHTSPDFLVVSAQPLSPGSTEVAVAGLSPTDQKLMDLAQHAPPTGAAGDTDRQVGEAIFLRPGMQRPGMRRLTMQDLTMLAPPAGTDVYARSSSGIETEVNRFIMELSVQMLGPRRWQALHAAEPRPAGQFQGHKPPKPYRREEIEDKTGDFVSASLRRSHVIVADSGVSEILDGMVRDLLRGAGQPDCEFSTYVIASPDVHAFALPNGDVFVSSGLLDSLDDRDELAFVLGHELDHLVQHDTLERLKRADSARITQMTIMVVGGTALSVVGGAVGAGVAAGASAGAMAAQQATTSAIMSTISTVGTLLGDAASAAIVEGYSQRSELRADSNAAQYALAAGYDPAAALEVFAKLHAIEVEAADARTAIKSSLINAKPGLEKRIERMKLTLAELGAGRTGKPR